MVPPPLLAAAGGVIIGDAHCDGDHSDVGLRGVEDDYATRRRRHKGGSSNGVESLRMCTAAGRPSCIGWTPGILDLVFGWEVQLQL